MCIVIPADRCQKIAGNPSKIHRPESKDFAKPLPEFIYPTREKLLRRTDVSQWNFAIGRVAIVVSVGIALIGCRRLRVVGAMIEIVGEWLAVGGSDDPCSGGLDTKFWRDNGQALVGHNWSQRGRSTADLERDDSC